MSIYFIDPDLSQNPFSVPDNILTKPPPVYPSTFLSTSTAKPSITCSVGTAALKYHGLLLMLNQHQWSDLTVTSFMTAVIEENPEIFEEVAEEDWKANDRTIALKNGKVTPLDILTISNGEILTESDKTTPSTKETRLSHFFGLLVVYKKSLTRSINDTESARCLSNYFKSNNLNADPTEIARYYTCYGEYNLTTDYKKLIAAIDMFFFKYDKFNFSKMRMATLPTRYRGCVVLTSIEQITKLTGLKIEELEQFILTESVAKEMAQVSKSGEGANDVYGYFPYQLDMGLTQRSPYSLSANPSLYLWLHTIGTMLNLPRSINAKMPSIACDLLGTVNSAVAVALSLTDSEKKVSELKDSDVHEKVNAVLMRLNSGLSKTELHQVKEKINSCKGAPEGTIGRYLASFFVGF